MDRSLEAMLYGTPFRRLIEREFLTMEEEYGLCKIDIQILFYLCSEEERNTSRDILDLELFTKGHVSQSLRRMEEHGLVTMVQDEKDRRVMHILLTDSAQTVLARVRRGFAEIWDIVFQGITAEEKDYFLRITRQINQNIRTAVER